MLVDMQLFNTNTLTKLASRWSNISKQELVDAGVITGKVGGSDWTRFNKDPMMFILKLPHDKLPALCNVLNKQ